MPSVRPSCFRSPGVDLPSAPTGPASPSGGGDGVRVYDVGTGRETLSLRGPVQLIAPAFSPDGTRIAVGGGDGALTVAGVTGVRVYDARSGQEAFSLGGRLWPGSPAFSPDGARIAAVGPDGVR